MRRNLSRQAQKRLMNELDGWFEGSPVPGMKVLSAESLDEYAFLRLWLTCTGCTENIA